MNQITRGLLSYPKYLSLRVRQLWLQKLISQRIAPEDGEGLVLEVFDWNEPLRGACEALGVSSANGELTTARPARLQTIRMGPGVLESAEGDGVRRNWLHAAANALLEPNHGLFVLASDGETLIPNAHSSLLVPDHLAHFALFGRLIGLALLHGEHLCKAAGRLPKIAFWVRRRAGIMLASSKNRLLDSPSSREHVNVIQKSPFGPAEGRGLR